MFQPILTSFLLGGIYAIIGIGFSLVFGVMKVANVAYGDFMVLSAYLCLILYWWLGSDPLFNIIIIAVVMFFLGFFLQKVLVNRLMRVSFEAVLIALFSISIIIENMLLLIFKDLTRTLSTPSYIGSYRLTESLAVSKAYLLAFVVALISIILLQLFLYRSYLGRSIRAACDDAIAAKLVGVKVSTVYAICFGISLILAGVAGVVMGITFSFFPFTGVAYLGTALCVTVIGGVGSIRGTFIGGIILGFVHIFGSYFLGVGYQSLIGFIMLFVLLAIRPQGLLGR